MHTKEYVHADIKSSNIMLGFSKASQLKVSISYYVFFYIKFTSYLTFELIFIKNKESDWKLED